MEHTSNYWKPIALTLKNAGFYVSVVNAMLIHDFSDNSIRKLKTDRADSLKIANYALTFWNKQSFLIKWISLNFIQSYIAASE